MSFQTKLSFVGAPRKYCKQCSREIQKKKDLENKRAKRRKDKVISLLKKTVEEPELMGKLKSVFGEVLEDIGKSQQQKRNTLNKMYDGTDYVGKMLTSLINKVAGKNEQQKGS
ncbi:MAG: hypothetical protein AABX33_06355 [Nanoarchaeota archaeon]